MLKFVRIVLFISSLLILTGCIKNEKTHQDLPNPSSESGVLHEVTKNTKENYKFFGVWKIDEVVLTSNMYTGTSKDGDYYVYDPADYIGDELEYQTDFFRLGDHIYYEPKYTIKYESVEEFQDGGIYRLPDIYGLLEEKKIRVNMEEDYDNLGEVPLLRFDVDFTGVV